MLQSTLINSTLFFIKQIVAGKLLVPRQFQDRLAAVSAFDYSIRADKKYQTRIKMGFVDLELHKKLRGTNKWEKVTLPSSLPPVDFSSRPAATTSSCSPPPGRPGHDYIRDNKRGRGSTGSDSGQNSSKIARQNDDNIDDKTAAEKEESWEKLVEEAVLVSDALNCPSDPKSKNIIDPGMITSVQGTPSKLYPSLDAVQSPILSRRKN